MFISRKEKKEIRDNVANLLGLMYGHTYNIGIYGGIGAEGVNKRLYSLEKKLNLLLDHLNLQYVPESTETKEARLDKKSNMEFYNTLDSLIESQIENQKKNVKRTAKK